MFTFYGAKSFINCCSSCLFSAACLGCLTRNIICQYSMNEHQRSSESENAQSSHSSTLSSSCQAVCDLYSGHSNLICWFMSRDSDNYGPGGRNKIVNMYPVITMNIINSIKEKLCNIKHNFSLNLPMLLPVTASTPSAVDREIFTVKNFSPVVWVAKIKILSRYTYNVNRGQVAKIKRAKI